MSEMHWDKWIENKCPQEKNWMVFNSCLKENTFDFKDLVLNQSHPAQHHIQFHKIHGIVHILSLHNDSIHQVKDIDKDPPYLLGLNKKIKYRLELRDPTFLYLSPNPLAFPRTTFNLHKNSSHQLLYLQVFFGSNRSPRSQDVVRQCMHASKIYKYGKITCLVLFKGS